jgi:hypothetical protein
MAYRDDDEDDRDHEGPDSVDIADEDDDQDLLTPCPHCRNMMYDDAERCPNCGEWVNSPGNARLPLWAILTALACLVVFIFLALR